MHWLSHDHDGVFLHHHDLAALVDHVALHGDDATLGLTGFFLVDAFVDEVNGIAGEYRVLESELGAQKRNRGIGCEALSKCQSRANCKREGAVANAMAEGCIGFRELLIGV